MAYEIESASYGAWYPPTRAHEVEKLIKIAEECGYSADTALFDRMCGIVYGNSVQSITPNIELHGAVIRESADVDKIMDAIADKISGITIKEAI